MVGDDLEHRQAGDPRVGRVRVLRGRMIPPDADVRNGGDRHLSLLCDLRPGSVLVEAGHREPALGGELRRVHARDVAVGVARIAHDQDANVGGRRLLDRHALWPEDAAIDSEQVASLHALLARRGADEQDPVRALESFLGLARQLHSRKQWESAVVQLHGNAFERFHGRFDLQEAEHDRLVGTEHLAGGDPEEERIADLACRAGDRDLDRRVPAAHIEEMLVRSHPPPHECG